MQKMRNPGLGDGERRLTRQGIGESRFPDVNNVVFQKSGCTSNIEKDEVEAFVDGKPLKDFIKEKD